MIQADSSYALSQRDLVTDLIRVIAIGLMVIYHFSYDLNYFGFIDLNHNQSPFWISLRYVILSGFCYSAGVSAVFQHAKEIRWPGFYARLIQLLAASLLVTLVSLVMFPERWIYFGILHFFSVASVLILPLLKRPYLALIVALLIMFEYHTNSWHIQALFSDLRQGLELPTNSEDLVPLVPWLAVVLWGVFMGHQILKRGWFLPLARVTNRGRLIELVPKLARHSLLIYLIHQPILFGILWPVKFFNSLQ